jgi:hypothetical protein
MHIAGAVSASGPVLAVLSRITTASRRLSLSDARQTGRTCDTGRQFEATRVARQTRLRGSRTSRRMIRTASGKFLRSDTRGCAEQAASSAGTVQGGRQGIRQADARPTRARFRILDGKQAKTFVTAAKKNPLGSLSAEAAEKINAAVMTRRRLGSKVGSKLPDQTFDSTDSLIFLRKVGEPQFRELEPDSRLVGRPGVTSPNGVRLWVYLVRHGKPGRTT